MFYGNKVCHLKKKQLMHGSNEKQLYGGIHAFP